MVSLQTIYNEFFLNKGDFPSKQAPKRNIKRAKQDTKGRGGT